MALFCKIERIFTKDVSEIFIIYKHNPIYPRTITIATEPHILCTKELKSAA